MRTNNKNKITSLDNNLLKISAEAKHFKTQGEIILDIKNDELKWILKGTKSKEFKDKYKNSDGIPTIKKSDIKDIILPEKKIDDDRFALKIELKNKNSYIFSFYGENKIKGYKIHELLDSDYFDYYKTEFKLLPIEHQKRICFLLNNKYLYFLYQKLYNCNQDIDFIWEIIKYLYPQKINANLGKNMMQLSRDEELIMFAQNKYNITKLISSDDNIRKSYLIKNNLKCDNFWDDFINNQRGNNNTYLAGGYNPSICFMENNNIEEEKKKVINIIFDDLEKDKYYYDNYDTNYLYIDKEMKKHQEKLKDKITILNDYSIDKMKNVNYFSYPSLAINYNKKHMKINNNKKVLESNISHINEEKNGDIIDCEENIEYNNNNKSRLSKNELLNKISNMKNEFKNEKKGKSAFDTMKVINNENYKMANLAKGICEIPNNKYINYIINYTFLIKDLLYAFKCEKNEAFSSHIQNKNKKFENYSREIGNNLEFLKKKRNQNDKLENLSKVVDFLIDNAEKAAIREDINKYLKKSN